MPEDRPVVYTVTHVDTSRVRIYTKDGRIREGDNDIIVTLSNLLNEMVIISKILNDEGFAVLFEVD